MNRENREILFRGQRLDNDEWAYGDLLHLPNGDVVILSDKGYTKVKPATVGQFTGLNDKRGCPIFEGDVVATFVNDRIQSVGDVQFKCGVFGVEWTENKVNRRMVGVFGQRHNLRRLDDETMDDIEVIGNRFEFPELLHDL